MVAKEQLVIEALVRDEVTRQMRRMGGEIEKFERSSNRALQQTQRGFRGLSEKVATTAASMGKAAVVAATLATAYSALRSSFRFGNAIAEVSTLVDETTVNMAQFERQILEIASTLGQDPASVAAGAYQALSAGISDANEALLVTEQSARLAVAGVAETKDTVNLLTTALNAYGLSADQAGRASDVFFKTVQLGKTTVPELSAALGRVLPIANQVGVSFEEVAAAVATLTLNGLSTAEAVTQVRAVLNALLRNAGAVDEAMRAVGGSFSAADIRANGLVEALQTIQTASGGTAEGMLALLGEVEAVGGASGLLANDASRLRETLDDLRGSAGATAEALEKQLSSPTKVIEKTANAVRVAFTSLGQEVVGETARVIQRLEDIPGGARVFEQILLGVKSLIGEISSGAVDNVVDDFVRLSAAVDTAASVVSGLVDQVSALDGALSAFGGAGGQLLGFADDLATGVTNPFAGLSLRLVDEFRDRFGDRLGAEIGESLDLATRGAEASASDTGAALGIATRKGFRDELKLGEVVVAAQKASSLDALGLGVDAGDAIRQTQALIEQLGTVTVSRVEQEREAREKVFRVVRDTSEELLAQQKISARNFAQIEEAAQRARLTLGQLQGIARSRDRFAFSLQLEALQLQVEPEGLDKALREIELARKKAIEPINISIEDGGAPFEVGEERKRQINQVFAQLREQARLRFEERDAEQQLAAQEERRVANLEASTALLSLEAERLGGIEGRMIQIDLATQQRIESARTLLGSNSEHAKQLEEIIRLENQAGDEAKQRARTQADRLALSEAGRLRAALSGGLRGELQLMDTFFEESKARLRDLEGAGRIDAAAAAELIDLLDQIYERDRVELIDERHLQQVQLAADAVALLTDRLEDRLRAINAADAAERDRAGEIAKRYEDEAGALRALNAQIDAQTASLVQREVARERERSGEEIQRWNRVRSAIDEVNAAVRAGTIDLSERQMVLIETIRQMEVEANTVRTGLQAGVFDFTQYAGNLAARGEEAGRDITFSMSRNLGDALVDIGRDFDSAGDAAEEFGRRTVEAIGEIAAQMAALQIVNGALGAFGFGLSPAAGFAGIGASAGGAAAAGAAAGAPTFALGPGPGFAFADGGVIAGGLGRMKPLHAYADGGPIVREPHVALIGEGRYDEAVVPLPNGRELPVDLRMSDLPTARETRSAQPEQAPVVNAAPVTVNVTVNAQPDRDGRVTLDPKTVRDIQDAVTQGVNGGNQSLRNAIRGLRR